TMRFGVRESFRISRASFPTRKRGFVVTGDCFPARPAATESSSRMSTYELCCRECGKTWGNQPRSICEDCFSPLEVTYDYRSIRRLITRQLFSARAPNLWRYRELLPLPAGSPTSLPTGFTPLLKAPQLGQRIGSNNLYLKNDAVCLPTLSFKDRVVAVAL